MGTEVIQQAAREAIGTETNRLRQMLRIRNTVYDRLSYCIKPHIDQPDEVWERGTGSCGEYVGVLLALARLNGIACRTVGRYKCPPHADLRGIPLQPDFNHVWLEFYLPGFGWLPMESNPDDIVEGGPYPTRVFYGAALVPCRSWKRHFLRDGENPGQTASGNHGGSIHWGFGTQPCPVYHP